MRQASHSDPRDLVDLVATARRVFPRQGIDDVTNVRGAKREQPVRGAHLEVLVAVAAYEGDSVGEIANRLGIHASGVGRALTSLREGGLVITDRSNRREAALTRAGRAAVDTVLEHAAQAAPDAGTDETR